MSAALSAVVAVPASVTSGAPTPCRSIRNPVVQVDFGDLVGTAFVQFSLNGTNYIDATAVGMTASGAVQLPPRIAATRIRLSAYSSGTTQSATVMGDPA